MVVEDEAQADKVLAAKPELPHLKAVVQYLGSPRREGVLSWEELLDMGGKVEEDELEDRLKRMAINQCCSLIYTSGTTGMPKVYGLTMVVGDYVLLTILEVPQCCPTALQFVPNF